MKIDYLSDNDKLVQDVLDDSLPCVLRLDLPEENLSVATIEYSVDMPGVPVIDIDSGLICWPIPLITAAEANALLSRVAPLAEVILSQYIAANSSTGKRSITSADIAMARIGQNIQELINYKMQDKSEMSPV